ncbi:hypothetical protein AB0B45_14480 [Nonomuraea sp. NPDC049152]|uniref:hypothetical protein n=1 Tax=Nonomuraea sp. NPDC049152 TaxID=3154350 RepID=UPI0033EBAA89
MTSGQQSTGPAPKFDAFSNTPYDEVIRFSRALSALLPPEENPNEDFVLFQSIHLMTEFSWYTMHYEFGWATTHLADGAYTDAARLVRRAARMQEVSTGLLATLHDEFDQVRFLRLRELLPNGGSGLDSAGMKNMWPAAQRLWSAFERALDEHGCTLLEAMTGRPETESTSKAEGPLRDLGEVGQALFKLDDSVIAWQQAHQRLVWGRLGGHPVTRRGLSTADARRDMPKSLTGRPVDLLDGFVRRVLFPKLWHATDQICAQSPQLPSAACPVHEETP